MDAVGSTTFSRFYWVKSTDRFSNSSPSTFRMRFVNDGNLTQSRREEDQTFSALRYSVVGTKHNGMGNVVAKFAQCSYKFFKDGVAGKFGNVLHGNYLGPNVINQAPEFQK